MPGLDWLISSSGYGGSGLNRPNSGQQPIYYPNGQVDSMATARAHLGRTPTAFEQMEYIDPSNLGPNQGVWDGGAGRQQEARAAGYTGAMPLRYQTGPSFQWGPNGAQRSAQDPTPGDYSGGGAAQSIARDVAYGQANGPAPMSQGNTYAMDPNAIGRNALPNMNNRAAVGQPNRAPPNPWGAQGPPSQEERAQQTVAQDDGPQQPMQQAPPPNPFPPSVQPQAQTPTQAPAAAPSQNTEYWINPYDQSQTQRALTPEMRAAGLQPNVREMQLGTYQHPTPAPNAAPTPTQAELRARAPSGILPAQPMQAPAQPNTAWLTGNTQTGSAPQAQPMQRHAQQPMQRPQQNRWLTGGRQPKQPKPMQPAQPTFGGSLAQ